MINYILYVPCLLTRPSFTPQYSCTPWKCWPCLPKRTVYGFGVTFHSLRNTPNFPIANSFHSQPSCFHSPSHILSLSPTEYTDAMRQAIEAVPNHPDLYAGGLAANTPAAWVQGVSLCVLSSARPCMCTTLGGAHPSPTVYSQAKRVGSHS
jgi:hypothetical protein